MVGKPNLPVDAEKRKNVHGAASPTPGLSALDEEREASMADEGGASGAAVEGHFGDEDEADEADEPPPGLDLVDTLIIGGIFTAGLVVGLLLGGSRRG